MNIEFLASEPLSTPKQMPKIVKCTDLKKYVVDNFKIYSTYLQVLTSSLKKTNKPDTAWPVHTYESSYLLVSGMKLNT